MTEKLPFTLAQRLMKIIVKDDKFYGVKSTQDGEQKEFTADGLFVFIGLIPNTQFLANSDVELDLGGHIITDEHLHTNIPGVLLLAMYARGQLCKSLRRLVKVRWQRCRFVNIYKKRPERSKKNGRF